MSAAKHTPGPWAVSGRTSTCIRTADQEQRIAYMETADNTIETCVANARLIAAAPELLEAAKDVIKLFHYHTEDAADAADFAAAVEIQLESAISKAEGRTNA